MIITIDGPSGSGKSTTARLLAHSLGFEFLDTGSMFRALALHFLRRGISADQSPLTPALAETIIRVEPGRVWVNDEELTERIRTPEVTSASSRIAVHPEVREFLAAQQRRVATNRDVVTEGRDQGTAVFPDAGVKFFLTANPEVRAERRCLELRQRGEDVTAREVLGDLLERDRRDSSRDVAPLKAAEDAIAIDTSELTLDGVLAVMEREVRRCIDA